jgi:hypothetical protein
MTIEYLKRLEKTPKIGTDKIKGVSESEIEKVEKKFNIVFPKSYREFLILAGEKQGCSTDDGYC